MTESQLPPEALAADPEGEPETPEIEQDARTWRALPYDPQDEAPPGHPDRDCTGEDDIGG